MSGSSGRSFPAHMPPCYVICCMRKFKVINFAVRLGSLSIKPCLLYKYIFRSFCYAFGSFHCRCKCLQKRTTFLFEFRSLCVPMKPSGNIGCPFTFWQNGMLQNQYEAQGKWVWKRIDATEGNYCTLLPPASSPPRSTQRILIQCQTERKAS